MCASAASVRGRPLICQMYELMRKEPTFISYYINFWVGTNHEI